MLMVAPHAAVVGDAARTTPPPERQRASLQEELAYVLLSVASFSGFVNDFKKAQLVGKLAMEVYQESGELSGGRKDGFFPQRVSIHRDPPAGYAWMGHSWMSNGAGITCIDIIEEPAATANVASECPPPPAPSS